MNQKHKLLELHNVYFTINSKTILQNIDVKIENKGITGVIGPSGSGKSTFLRLLNKLISPTGGKILFKGENIEDLSSRKVRKQIGLVQQQPFLFEGTVRNNLLYGPKIWGIEYTQEELSGLLAKVALPPEFLSREIGKLSLGEKQRVSLARSLANNPKVLLLDEPTSALDIHSEEIIEHSLKTLNTEGIKIIIVTHSLEQTKRLANQLLFLKEGSLMEKTTVKAFFKQYNEDEVKSFFGKKEEETNG